MGRKIRPTPRRLGISFYGSKVLKYDKPFELRASTPDLHGWDRNTPSSHGVQRFRLSVQYEYQLRQRLTQYCKALGILLLRSHFKEQEAYYQVHCFALSKYQRNNLMEKRLQLLCQSTKPINIQFHFVRQLAEFNFKHFELQFKNPMLFRIGSELLNLIVTKPCNQNLVDWLAYCFTELNRPLISLWMIQNLCQKLKVSHALKGLRIVIKGRIQGAEKSKQVTYHWGRLPRETLRQGLSSASRRAFTPQGTLGFNVITHYK